MSGFFESFKNYIGSLFYIPTVQDNKVKKWYNSNNQLHRDNDQPAVIGPNYQAWYVNGVRHRDNDQPAVIKKCKDGSNLAYFNNGKIHRDNGNPALVYADGSMEWFVNGQHKNTNNGPVCILVRRIHEHLEDNNRYLYDDHDNRVSASEGFDPKKSICSTHRFDAFYCYYDSDKMDYRINE